MEREFVISLHYAGGQYTLGLEKIKPHQTKAIDFKKYRDEQIPDVNEQIIPLNIEAGQIAWSSKGIEAHKTLTGYSEQVSEAEGIASTYNCANCCPNSYWDSWLSPGSASGYIGDTTQFVFNLQNVNCYGQVQPSYPVNFGVNWSSGNSSVATCNQSGFATGTGVGETVIMANYLADSFTPGEYGCESEWVIAFPLAFCNIAPSVTEITASEATKITKIKGNSKIVHFVTPKVEEVNDTVTLTATISPDTQAIRNNISWEGATENSSNPLKASVSKTSASKNVVKIKYTNKVLK